MNVSDAAVEAAARAMAPAVWGPSVWQFAAHGEAPADARDRVQQQALQDARAALEAAAPHMLAEAWDEGSVAGWVESGLPHSWNAENKLRNSNPYRTAQ